MTKNRRAQHVHHAALAVLAVLAGAAPAAAETRVERSPLQIGTALDVGQIVNGVNMVDSVDAIEGQMIQRTAVYLSQTTTVDDRLAIKVGVGGLFFYGFPERPNNAQSRSVRFGPGVGQAQGTYKVGDLDAPSWTFQFGYFPYKYNPDAKNLGEYLLRSGTYPGYQVTGGWSIINSAAYMASGLRVNSSLLDGRLSTDLNLFMERDLEPAYDLSPSVVTTLKPFPALEIGAGVMFAHLVPANPSKLLSKGTKYRGDTLATRGDTLATPFTFQGVKLMGRASFGLGRLLDQAWIGRDGLKLYAEAAVLGVENKPYYFTDITRRIPVMLGLNLPTFGLFDVLAVEYEYRNWEFPNSTRKVMDESEAVWRIPAVSVKDTVTGFVQKLQDPHLYSPGESPEVAAARARAYIDAHQAELAVANARLEDPSQTAPDPSWNHKWTVYVRRQFMEGFSLYLQAASDHLRGIRFDDNTLDREILTQRPGHWYYLFRLEFGI